VALDACAAAQAATPTGLRAREACPLARADCAGRRISTTSEVNTTGEAIRGFYAARFVGSRQQPRASSPSRLHRRARGGQARGLPCIRGFLGWLVSQRDRSKLSSRCSSPGSDGVRAAASSCRGRPTIHAFGGGLGAKSMSGPSPSRQVLRGPCRHRLHVGYDACRAFHVDARTIPIAAGASRALVGIVSMPDTTLAERSAGACAPSRCADDPRFVQFGRCRRQRPPPLRRQRLGLPPPSRPPLRRGGGAAESGHCFDQLATIAYLAGAPSACSSLLR
jgi:hypothetical protein